MGNVVKAQNIVPIKDKAKHDLESFIFAELKDHLARLHDCALNGSDEVTTDYHYEKAQDMISMLEKER